MACLTSHPSMQYRRQTSFRYDGMNQMICGQNFEAASWLRQDCSSNGMKELLGGTLVGGWLQLTERWKCILVIVCPLLNIAGAVIRLEKSSLRRKRTYRANGLDAKCDYCVLPTYKFWEVCTVTALPDCLILLHLSYMRGKDFRQFGREPSSKGQSEVLCLQLSSLYVTLPCRRYHAVGARCVDVGMRWCRWYSMSRDDLVFRRFETSGAI